MAKEPTHDKVSLFRFKGLFPAVGLILFGAVLMLASNLLLTDKTKVAVQNAQTQAQVVQESSLCQDSPEEEEACVQAEKILKNPTSSVPGPQGVQGYTGAQGSTGPRGPEGAIGPIGPQGLVGPVGPQGLQGFFGESGLQGLQGLQGEVGPMGPAGVDGLSGANGSDGAYPTGIDINCSTETATVTLSNGTSFTGSVTCTKGDTGDVGPTGPPGPAGPPGKDAVSPVPVIPGPTVPAVPE